MNKIKEAREKLGISQAALGHQIGCSQQHIQRLENGYEPTPDKILSLSKALNIPVEDLVSPNLKKIIYSLQGNYPPKSCKSLDGLDITEEKFMEIISTAFNVFVECMPENKNKIKNIGLKMAEICLSATKADTTDRKGQLQAMVINLYQKKAI